MEKHDLHLMIRVLNCIDYDMNMLTEDQWAKFRENPCKFFVQCDGPTSDKIWDAAIKSYNRQR